ncbi:MAG: hypothetical protein RLZZ263_807 [Cyanobacteriota bacterium]|jgi:hypothetical protein
MAQQTIRFRIRPDGRVDELVEGLAGVACEQLTDRIEAQLGVVQRREPTAEAFAVTQVSQDEELPVQHHLASAATPGSDSAL